MVDVEKARALLAPAPIRKLPNEMLLEIFAHLMSQSVFTGGHLAFTQPPPTPTTRTTQNFLINLQQHLLLAGAVPLEIDIRATSLDDARLQEVMSRSSQWKTLRLRFKLRSGELIPHITHLPSLETLEILQCEDTTFMKILLKSSPKLHTLRLGAVRGAVRGGILAHVPWNQIINLSVHRRPCVALFSEPGRCNKLQSLRIAYANLVHRTSSPHSTIISQNATNLRKLTFSFSARNDLSQLITDPDYTLVADVMSSLTAPVLGTLELVSGCLLTTLVLDDVTFPDEDILMILTRTPSLLNLTIREPISFSSEGSQTSEVETNVITPNLLEQVAVSRTPNSSGNLRSPLVPKLAHIWLRANGESFDETAFVDMILSRWLAEDIERHIAHAAGLDQLVAANLCVVGRQVDREVWGKLDCVKRSGMKVKLWDEDFPKLGMLGPEII
ncbi:hypothetical protein D9758_012326 [Tetrapyrgos nigripes]|uniref:F-box domain-containing protein n=1 Tax=Tetrapyrgos nigripes TaxID=182062 RepID=A0A8H5CNR9_9AGAR|nr:hypothetical protein D9758_012326 [Tetrapyrgos nigripes]